MPGAVCSPPPMKRRLFNLAAAVSRVFMANRRRFLAESAFLLSCLMSLAMTGVWGWSYTHRAYLPESGPTSLRVGQGRLTLYQIQWLRAPRTTVLWNRRKIPSFGESVTPRQDLLSTPSA